MLELFVLLSYNISPSFPDTLQNLLNFFLELLSLRFPGLHENFVKAILGKEPVFCIGAEAPAHILSGYKIFKFLFTFNRLKHFVHPITSVRSFTVINPLCNISCQEQRIFRCTKYTDAQSKYYLLWLFIGDVTNLYVLWITTSAH